MADYEPNQDNVLSHFATVGKNLMRTSISYMTYLYNLS